MKEITVHDLKERLDQGEEFCLLDVREPDELRHSRLEGVINITAKELARRMKELDPERTTVVICRTGNRSAMVTRILDMQGFREVMNLRGGMNHWVREIDPTMETY